MNKEKNITVLIVDDELEVCLTLQEFVKDNFDFTCMIAGSADEAISIFEEHSLYLIIADINMPEKSGIDLLHDIKKTSNGKYTDVILMTGIPDLESAISALREGAYDYFIKPFNLEELKAVIEKSIEHQKLMRENEAIMTSLIQNKES